MKAIDFSLASGIVGLSHESGVPVTPRRFEPAPDHDFELANDFHLQLDPARGLASVRRTVASRHCVFRDDINGPLPVRVVRQLTLPKTGQRLGWLIPIYDYAPVPESNKAYVAGEEGTGHGLLSKSQGSRNLCGKGTNVAY